MPLPDEAQRVLLRRYRSEIDQLIEAGGRVASETFRRIGSLDEAAIARFIDEAGPALRDVSARAGASASGVAAMLTDSPVGVPGVVDPDLRGPFTAGWRALGDGVEFDEAFEQAASVADAAGRNAVASTAREAVAASAPAGTKWRRITDGDACDWCIMVAQREYNSASTANFGHDRCGCMVVPADAAANAPGGQTGEVAAVDETTYRIVDSADELSQIADASVYNRMKAADDVFELAGVDDEAAAVFEYMRSGFERFNGSLRRNDLSLLEPGELQLRDALQRAIATSKPTTEPVRVFRGAQSGDWVDDLVPGSRLTDQGFLSTSGSQKEAQWFASNSYDAIDDAVKRPGVVFEIDVPAGSQAVFMPTVEMEMVFQAGSSLNITGVSVDASTGMRIVKAILQ